VLAKDLDGTKENNQVFYKIISSQRGGREQVIIKIFRVRIGIKFILNSISNNNFWGNRKKNFFTDFQKTYKGPLCFIFFDGCAFLIYPKNFLKKICPL
jgi:hypothetical protein